MVVAWFSSNGVAIHLYLGLLVIWITSYLDTIGHMGYIDRYRCSDAIASSIDWRSVQCTIALFLRKRLSLLLLSRIVCIEWGSGLFATDGVSPYPSLCACVSVCLLVCWSRSWATQERTNRSRYRLGWMWTRRRPNHVSDGAHISLLNGPIGLYL